MTLGGFTFVLHSHLPYARRAGRWPHGEEWLHEAASETYIPLLNAFYDLREEGVPFRLTIGITPVLAEQLADSLVQEHFIEYLSDKIAAAAKDIERFNAAGDGHMKYLALFYHDWYTGVQQSFLNRFSSDILGAFKQLQDEGYIEIITSAATHGYLPLLERDSSISGQLSVGKASYMKHFGREPRAIWLPECAYRPAYYADGATGKYYKPGIEEFLAEQKELLFFSETNTVEGGKPVGKAAGDAVGPYGGIPQRYVVPQSEYAAPTNRTTFNPYYVHSPVVSVLGRNKESGMQVWSAEHGYPGDFNYREFHRKDGVSGMQYWKVTGSRVDLGEKEPYDPYWAQQRIAEHAAHFASLVERLTSDYSQQHDGKPGIIASAYDTELFGHWWFEGPDWMKHVLRNLAKSEVVELTTASGWLDQHPSEDVLDLPESSWGQGGTHFVWQNADTEWMWPIIHAAEYKMEELVAHYPTAEGDHLFLLQQAARELVLLESSDWPFLVTTGQAGEYAINRFNDHVARFNELADALTASNGTLEGRAIENARDYFDRDNLFPDIDYTAFKERERKSA